MERGNSENRPRKIWVNACLETLKTPIGVYSIMS